MSEINKIIIETICSFNSECILMVVGLSKLLEIKKKIEKQNKKIKIKEIIIIDNNVFVDYNYNKEKIKIVYNYITNETKIINTNEKTKQN